MATYSAWRSPAPSTSACAASTVRPCAAEQVTGAGFGTVPECDLRAGGHLACGDQLIPDPPGQLAALLPGPGDQQRVLAAQVVGHRRADGLLHGVLVGAAEQAGVLVVLPQR